MVLTNLGTNQVNVGDGFVTYNPINLLSDREYLVELQFIATDGDALFSSFTVSFAYPTNDTPLSGFLGVYEFVFAPIPQHFPLRLSPNLATTGNCILAIKRIPWYRDRSNLGVATIQLGIDPNIFTNY